MKKNKTANPKNKTNCRAIIHYLHNMEYTGMPYQGSRREFMKNLAEYIYAYRGEQVSK